MGSPTSVNNQARICLLSQRLLKPTLARCCGYEFEDVIQSIDSVDIIIPDHRDRLAGLQKQLQRISNRTMFSWSIKPSLSCQKIEKMYDLFFFRTESIWDLELLRSIDNWREHSRIAICLVEEMWVESLAKCHGRRNPLHILKEFDHIFVNCSGSVSRLSDIIQRPCTYIPPGIDALRFCPSLILPDRTIDVYSMGRRSSVTHDALLKLTHNSDFFYMYDTTRSHYAIHPAMHRTMLANIIKRSKYFIANYAKADRECYDQTKGQQEIGFRFFEGAAGGAVLIGSPPDTDEFRNCFDWTDAIIPIPFDCENIGEIIDELNRQPERIAIIRKNNIINTQRKHDWMYRWEKILQAAGLTETDGMDDRRVRLDQLASTAE